MGATAALPDNSLDCEAAVPRRAVPSVDSRGLRGSTNQASLVHAMHDLRCPLTRRAGPLFGVVLTVLGGVGALTPVVPGARALDPTPAAVAASPDPAASPSAGPAASASPDPAASPSASPGGSGSGSIGPADVTLFAPDAAVPPGTHLDVVQAIGPDYRGAQPLKVVAVRRIGPSGDLEWVAFARPVTVRVRVPESAASPDALRIAALTSGGAWRVLPTTLEANAVSAVIAGPAELALVVDAPASSVPVATELARGDQASGRRADPGRSVRIVVGATPGRDVSGADLVLQVPGGWTVVDLSGGTWDSGLRQLVWPARGSGGSATRQTVVVTAPDASPALGRPSIEGVFAGWLDYAGGVSTRADLLLVSAPRLIVEHYVMASADLDTGAAGPYQASDMPLDNVAVPSKFRVRFQVRNAGTTDEGLNPTLQYRALGSADWTTVPSGNYVNGVAFFASPDRLSPQADPRLPDISAGAETETIRTGELKLADTDDAGQQPAPGTHSRGVNPIGWTIVGGQSYTEVEFTVRSTVAAAYLEGYEFRLADGATALEGAVNAEVRIGAAPPVVLSPGQRAGVVVGSPVGLAPASLSAPLSATRPSALLASASVPAASGLVIDAALARAVVPPASGPVLLAAPVVGTHGPYGTTPDACAICHRTHTGQNKDLLKVVAPQSTLCFTCHDSAGTGANNKTQLQYTDALVPANSTDNYYRHDALVTTNHSMLQLNEFGGVLNRHDECGDCHNSHAATSTLSTQTTTGWTAAGQQAQTSGVSVANSATAGAAPTYTFVNGVTSQLTREYQLCFKCHSGFTTLLANPTGTPTPYSKYRLDKAIEFNPANASYHPIEAAGKNTTTAMNTQLSETSSYKQWTFTTTSTIRCVNCHGDYRKYNKTTPPAAGSDLAPHTSQYRGILLQNYRDRTLLGATDSWNTANFALCFLCHGEAPFADTSGNSRSDTNFRFHGYHVGNLPRNTSTSYNIDSSGAGRGYALCAECHFRIHSTTYRTGTQAAAQRLVNFAPNVTYSGSTPWNQTNKSCTLTCHGVNHFSYSY